jgi:hypothetical protein
VDINHENQQVGQGFELTRIPEGIPSQAEYLAGYCSASVKPIVKLLFNIAILLHCSNMILCKDIKLYGHVFFVGFLKIEFSSWFRKI